MKRLITVLVGLFIVLGVTATSAFAAITFHQGPTFANVSESSNGAYDVNLFAEASGLGNDDMLGVIAFSATVQYTCQNKGGNTAPGQPLQIDQQSSQPSRTEPKNGRALLNFTASLSVPATVPGDEIGCPNGKWTGINPVVIGTVTATGTIFLESLQGSVLFGPNTIDDVIN
jgi:hypothetical protein